MKLSAWANKNGISYQTAWRMFRDGRLPVPSEQLPTGTIIVHVEEPTPVLSGRTVAYCRVSSSDQREDLNRQVARVALAHPGIDQFVTEIGSGMNAKRPKLQKILADPDVTTIVVEHRERLTRFGFEMLESALSSSGRKIIILAHDELEDDMVRDIVDFMTSICARMYGKRSSARHDLRERLADVLENDD